MRIAILSHGIMPFGIEVAAECSRQGHEVQFWSLSELNQDYCVNFSGFELLPRAWWRHRYLRRLFYLLAVIPLRMRERRWKPDVVIAIYLTSAGLLTGILSTKNIVLCAIGSDVNDHIMSFRWRAVLRYVCGRAAFIHSVSAEITKKLVMRLGVPAEKIMTVPIGVDTRNLAFLPQNARPREAVVICTRRHERIYDHETLLKAIKRVEDCGCAVTLLMIASPGHETTKKLARELGVRNVSFLPAFEKKDLPGVLARANIYASCSVSDGTSQSLLEAMSVGLLPIVSNIPANAPWVSHGINGFLFPVGDHVSLAQLIIDASRREDLRSKMCEVNRQIVVQQADIQASIGRLLGHVAK